MQPSLSIGTVLQNRYRLTKILGQGGFGRTYLAEDQGRFKELCALKELIPPTGAYPLEKSKELFQREAAILYQIQHPQIPQFRATFEQDGRLFLVQEYVEGKTYRALLSEGKNQGKRFSEAEIWQLLQQLLPVLNHIHAKGIIHRDISPDNIILRESDLLPVLIDFGVVKELVTRLQYPQGAAPATMVGKLGYAPSEQIQTGRAYPSSDLYSLAVTAVVLLTGQEPQVLFDETTLGWNWYRWIPPVHPGLTQVLNRMLSYRPGDRYQDAREVARALNDALNPQSQVAPPVNVATDPNLSQVQTLAVASPQPSASATVKVPQAFTAKAPSPRKQPDPVEIPDPTSTWDNPLLVTVVGIFLAILAGVGSWSLVSYVLKRQPVVQNTTPTVPLVAEPAPVFADRDSSSVPINVKTPTPFATTEPTTYSKRITLVEGASFGASDNLKANATVNYIFAGKQGQKLTAFVQESGVLMTVLGPNEEPIDNQSKQVKRWEGELPFDGNYTLKLNTIKGLEESRYNLNLLLTQLEPSPTPTPTSSLSASPTDGDTATDTPTDISTPTPTPTNSESPPSNLVIDTETLDFPTGSTGTQTFGGDLSPQNIKRYLVNVKAGQILSVRIQNGNATLDISYPSGKPIEDASGLGEWESKIDEDGQYKIDVKSERNTMFSVDISVRN